MGQDFKFWLFFFFFENLKDSATWRPESPSPLLQLEAVSFGKRSCFPPHHIPNYFLWTYISFLHSCMLLPGSCSFFLFVTLTNYWSTSWGDDYCPLLKFLDTELEEHLLKVGRTVYPWLKLTAPWTGCHTLEGLHWFFSNSVLPMKRMVHRVKGKSPPSPYSSGQSLTQGHQILPRIWPPENGVCCGCTYTQAWEVCTHIPRCERWPRGAVRKDAFSAWRFGLLAP